MLSRLKSIHGFSLVEVIAVLVILIIVSAVIVSQSGTYSTDLVTQTEILKTHLRYAQSMSMASVDPTGIFGIKCDTAFYWAFQGTDPDANIIQLLDDQRYNTNNDNKLDLSEKKIDISVPYTIYFDHSGIPYSAYTSATVNTPLASDLAIVLTPDGEVTPTETITVTQHTGFIP